MSAAPDARVVLRTRGLFESADLAIRFTTLHLRPYLWLSLVTIVPGLLACLAMRYVLDADWVATWLVGLTGVTILEAPFTILTGQLALRHQTRTKLVLRTFATRLVPFVCMLVLAWSVQLLAASMMFVPWVFAALVTVFIPEVVLLEGGGMRSFARAVRVVGGHNGRAFGLVLALSIARVASVLLVDLTLRSTLGMLLDIHVRAESIWSDGGSPYGLVGLWLSAPLCAVVRYFAYLDLRTLKEGWDIQRRFQMLAARLAAEART